LFTGKKYEFDDALPRIYQDVTGEPFPDPCSSRDRALLGSDEWNLLRDICSEIDPDPMHFELMTRLLGTEQQYQIQSRRVNIFKKLETCFDTSSRSKEDAIDTAKAERDVKDAIAHIQYSDDLEPVKHVLSGWAAAKFGNQDSG
jgi:DNA sulfur modification protein DndC